MAKNGSSTVLVPFQPFPGFPKYEGDKAHGDLLCDWPAYELLLLSLGKNNQMDPILAILARFHSV